MTTTNNTKTGPCGYCGFETDGYHSGVWECERCWMWRKLDGAAASYWEKRMTEALSQFDFHDYMTFLPNALGSKDKVNEFVEMMIRVKQYAQGAELAEMIRRGIK